MKKFVLPPVPTTLFIRSGGPAKVRALVVYRLNGTLWRKYRRRLWRTTQFLVPIGCDATLVPVGELNQVPSHDFSIVYEEAQSSAPYHLLSRPILVPSIRRPPHAKRGTRRRGLEFFSGVKAAVFAEYMKTLKEKL